MTIALFGLGLMSALIIWVVYQKRRSVALVDFIHFPIQRKDQIRALLFYTPKRPIFFLFKSWGFFGSSIKEIVLKPRLKMKNKGILSFYFKTNLIGVSNYQLTYCIIEYQHNNDTLIWLFRSYIKISTVKGAQEGWIRDEDNRLIKVAFKNTKALFHDFSQDDFFEFYERDEQGNLQLTEENKPILLGETMPAVREYLMKRLYRYKQK